MILGDSPLSVFATAAGFSPDKLSLLIRTFLLALVFLWGGWCVYGEMHHFFHHNSEIYDLLRKISRISIVVTLAIILVYVP